MILRLATLGLGYGLLTIGVIGLILPIIHGTLFFIAGLVILSRREPWAAALLERLKARHPRVRSLVERAERFTQRGMRRLTVRLGRLLKPARGA